ncbi:MAG TPA: tetratricopeptide repeat protein, partial [Sedimentisphaerales bacterium]|nr:tetratricopeptide repeat protein [Sedimentisphaerales bacterium]
SEYRVDMAEVGLLAAQGPEKNDETIAISNKIVEKFPDEVEPVRFIAALYDRQADSPKSEAVIKQAAERIKDPLARRDLNLLLAQFYDRWDRPEDACTVLEALSIQEPDSIPIKRRLLSNRVVVKDPAKTQKLINQIKAIEGDQGWQWRFEQARLWFNGTDFNARSSEIISILKENISANPDDQASRVMLAQTYERSGRSQMALAAYREALSRSPQDVQLIVGTVTALFNAQEYNEAARILDRVSKDKLAHPAIQNLQFQNLIRRGDLTSAANMLKEYLITDPNNVPMGLSLAVLKLEQRQFDDARRLLDELRAKDPNSLPTIVAQIELNVRQNKPDEVLKLCDEVTKDHQNALSHLIRGRAYASLKQPEKAAEDFDRAVSMEPNNPDVWIARSDFYALSGQQAKAMADMEQALAKAPANVSIQRRAVDMFLASRRREKVQQANTIIDRSLESNPDNADLRLLRAKALLVEPTAPSVQDAIQILEKLTQDRPEFSEVWGLLAGVLTSQGQSAKAIDTILEGLVHNEKDRTLLLMKAQAEAAKSPFLAIATLKQLLAEDSNDMTATMLLADAYVATNEADKAEGLLTELLTRCDPSLKRLCRIALAAAMYTNNKKTQAQAEFDSLLADEPNDPTPLLTHVRMLIKDKLWDPIEGKALDWYQKHPDDIQTILTIAQALAANEDATAQKAGENVLKMAFKDHGDDIRLVGTLAVLMQRLERNDEAAEFYKRVIEIRPDDVVSLNNLAWILCEHQDKHAEALDLAQRGLKLAPKYIDLIDTRGIAYYRMGKFTDAIRDFTDCIKLYPQETAAVAAVHFHLARAFAKANDADNALQNLNKAFSLNEKLGGLSPGDLAEAKQLLEQLSKEGG